MQTIREAEEADRHQPTQESAEDAETSRSATDRLKQVLSLAVGDYLAGDRDRLLMNAEQPPLGFSIQFQFPDSSLGADWALPSFGVVGTVEHDKVTLSVKDGHWEYIDGYLGNWANWTDEVPVYSDRLADSHDEAQLRRALDQAFLTWYKRVTNVQ